MGGTFLQKGTGYVQKGNWYLFLNCTSIPHCPRVRLEFSREGWWTQGSEDANPTGILMGDDVAAVYNDFLPALNAVLNASAAVLLALGYYFIKKQRKIAHRNVMIVAFAVSSAFLVSYLYYHFNFTARKFPGSGFFKNLYITMLISHILGAIILVPGVIATLWHAYKKNWIKHTRWSRKVWPLWMYISVTGVIIYFSLYGVTKS